MTQHYVYEEQPVDVEYGERERHTSTFSTWSPAQIIGLVIGIGITVLGFAAVAAPVSTPITSTRPSTTCGACRTARSWHWSRWASGCW